ncbi:hypothetical protein ACM72P_27585 [Pseudomonas aeruginosa]|uniref:hypothetical protein n=1 Tax=Pseudomonas aeruginosa TaxID=287 RepID=UPI003907E812
MSSTQHQLIEQCATRLRGIVEALDNIHDNTPHRWSTDLDDVHSSAESLLALIKDQAPTQAAQGLAGAALAQPSPAQAEQAEVKRLREAYEWGYDDGQNNPNGYSDKKERDACVNKLLKQPSLAQAEAARLREENANLILTCASLDSEKREMQHKWDAIIAERDAALARVAEFEAQAQHSVPEEFIGRLSEFLAQRGATGKALLRELRAMLAAEPGKEVPQAWIDVQAERRRQITAEGWTPEHDDEHSYGQMGRAAACYALAGSSAPNDGTAALLVSLAWPWDEQWWKPSTARRDLVKACALALAEIERLDRATATQGGPRDA